MATKGQVYDKKSSYERFRSSTDFADCSSFGFLVHSAFGQASRLSI